MTNAVAIRQNSLARNTLLNLIGQIVPAFVAIFTMPYVIHSLGPERFGILSLSWVILGYLSMFDLGLGRATTKFVAEALGRSNGANIPAIVWTSLFSQTLLSVIGVIALALIAPFLVERVFAIPSHLVKEAKTSVSLLVLCLPVLLYSWSLKGVLEAAQRFDLVNAVRIPSTSLTFLLPAVAVALGFQLPGIVLFLMISMVITGLAYLALCLKVFPALRHPSVSRAMMRPLFSYGGWVTLCSVLIPVLIYSDRLLIGALVSIAALAYYSAPYELASRLQIFPWSFSTTLFPAFSTVAGLPKDQLRQLYPRSMKYLLLVMGPLALVVIIFARDILQVWLGGGFAVESTLVLQILAAGMLLNALAQIPANLLDAVGRPDLRAKIFLSYVGVYIAIAWFLISELGIVGAALAWTLRSALEFGLFFGACWKLLRFEREVFVESGFVRGLVAYGLAAGFTIVITKLVGKGVWIQGTVTGVCLALLGVVVWSYVLDDTDKHGLRRMLPAFGLGR